MYCRIDLIPNKIIQFETPRNIYKNLRQQPVAHITVNVLIERPLLHPLHRLDFVCHHHSIARLFRNPTFQPFGLGWTLQDLFHTNLCSWQLVVDQCAVSKVQDEHQNHFSHRVWSGCRNGEGESYRKNLHHSLSIKMCFLFDKWLNQMCRRSPNILWRRGGDTHKRSVVFPHRTLNKWFGAQRLAALPLEGLVGVSVPVHYNFFAF